MSRKSHFRPAAERKNAALRAPTARTPRATYRRRLGFEPLEDRRVLSAVAVTTLEDQVDFRASLTTQPSAERVALSLERHERALLAWLEKHDARPGQTRLQRDDDLFSAGETRTDDDPASDLPIECDSIDQAFAVLA